MKRFFNKVEKTDYCWIWKASVDINGYGQFQYKKRMLKSHRFYWEFINGEVPRGKELDHLCRNKKCVNPGHLEAVSHKENMRRGLTNVASINIIKTHCPKGHSYSGENLIRTKVGRICRICTNSRNLSIYHKNKEKIKVQKKEYYKRKKEENGGKVPW